MLLSPVLTNVRGIKPSLRTEVLQAAEVIEEAGIGAPCSPFPRVSQAQKSR